MMSSAELKSIARIVGTDNFARLETINGLQVLAELVCGDDGPKIRVRRDDGVSCEITIGPWLDTEDGWKRAETALEKANMHALAENLDDILAKMKSQ
jgi:hypothetical protein